MATRPADANGLGLSLAQATAMVEEFRDTFSLLSDGSEIHDDWLDLVRTVGARSAQVHDARLATYMRVHGLTRILTFNGRDFRRYPGIEVIDPQESP